MDNYIYDNLNSNNHFSINSNGEIIENDNFSIEETNTNNEETNFHECSICYENIFEDKKILSCSHIFHKNCIDSWTKINPICPYCRKFLAEDFSCKIIKKFFSLKCKIIINEESFSKIIINYYYPLSKKIYKSYIIPTTFIKSVETNKKICVLLLKISSKTPVIKCKFKFKTSELSNQFSDLMKRIFDKYLSYYQNEVFENEVFENEIFEN